MVSNSDDGIYRTTLKKKNSKRIDYFAYTLALLCPPTKPLFAWRDLVHLAVCNGL